MNVQDVINALNDWAPFAYAEDFDNIGLLVGNKEEKITGILVTLDTLEEIVDEAIDKKTNLIVSFHPIIFKGLKSLTGKNYVERAVIKALKNDIAIIAIHTALDNAIHGVSARLAEEIGLHKLKILLPKNGTIKQLTTYVPLEHQEKVKNSLHAAGAGNIGNYSECSFTANGLGSFKANKNANPTIGIKDKREEVKEAQINITFLKHQESSVLKALFTSHPYEQVAYEITSLDNKNQTIGMGMVGELDRALSENEFLTHLKNCMKTDCIRHSNLKGKNISKVAVLGGSGSFAITAAKYSGADAYVTADLKYHDFFQAENDILLADIGHYESEQYTKNLIAEYLTKKIASFAPALPSSIVKISGINTNPIKYY